MKITEALRPELGTALTPGGGRTVFTVVTPDEDSQANTIIIGHMHGSKGYCTNDFPTYAKCASGVSPGDEVGPIAGSRILSPDGKGYLVMGDVSNGMARVRRKDVTPSGSIAFTMLTDRTRETVSGNSIGRAQALITDFIGDIPDDIGDTVEVIFTDKRWLESVRLCEGEADVVEGQYIVKEVQGLVQGFWFRTLAHRASGAPTEDILVEVIQNVGHANDDLPRQVWTQGGDQGGCTGSSTWTWTSNGWALASSTCSAGCSPVPPSGPTLGLEEGSFGLGGCLAQGQQPPAQEIKVRYLAGTFPRMREGAIGYATLDNDITNTSDNSTMRYFVVQSDQLAQILTGFLTAHMCGTPAAVAGISVASIWPLSQIPDPVPVVIPNPKGHYGRAGDAFTAFWNEAILNYELIDVSKHAMAVSLGQFLDYDPQTNCTSIKETKITAALEICGQASTSTIYGFQISDVTNVTGIRVSANEVLNEQDEVIGCAPKIHIDAEKRRAFTLCEAYTTPTIELALTSQTVIIDVDFTGCPVKYTQSLFVLGICDDLADYEGDCEDCPTEPPP